MKIINTIFLLLSFNILIGQVSPGFNYQAVARDASGEILSDQNIGLRIKLLQGGIDEIEGTIVYTKYYSVLTNQFGLINIMIDDTDVIYGALSGLQWGNNDFYLQVEMDINGGTDCDQLSGGADCTLMGTSRIMPVPIAMYALEAGSTEDGWQSYGDGIKYGEVSIGVDAAHQIDVKGVLRFDTHDDDTPNGDRIYLTTLGDQGSRISHTPGWVMEYKAGPGSGSDAGQHKFYTTYNGIYSNKLTIKSNGHIGLGENYTDPNGQFSILGDSLNDFTLKTSNDNARQGIAFQNSGNSYTWNIFRRTNSAYTADLVFAGNSTSDSENDISALNPYMIIKAGGKIGIGTEAPAAKLQIKNGDVYLEDMNSGIIMTSPNGNCWRLTINDDGDFEKEAITCPN